MYDTILEAINQDKIFDNPILGKCTCKSFSEGYWKCQKSEARSTNIAHPCKELRDITRECYSRSTVAEVNAYIMREFKEMHALINFLKQRGSNIPPKILENSWSVFANKVNLRKYSEYLKIQQFNKRIK